ncbi:hypothetical protein GCM10011581_21590 [Saccharopolyspora subtropica]|uniref:Uncharacterized protein n=1 Tax=Saccharopolyspora thermophila TaxID=89367 RepID=A0A917JTY6_9PSEU|nr:hypothetical protein [Saccharopolyspora subtropica]GGI84051.1 hypothetical protein GCM10011581_21590 [Saccharopolyspora subtropica]
MGNPDTGVISLLIASGTLLLGLLIFAHIQRMRLLCEQHAETERTNQLVAETREMRAELRALNAEIAELRRVLTEAA